METPVNSIESLFERVESYSKTTYELSKLKLLETSTVIATSVLSKVSVIFMFSVFAVITTIGVALWLGEILGKSSYGFFIVAGFYLFVGIISHFFLHKMIKKPISRLIIKQALKKG